MNMCGCKKKNKFYCEFCGIKKNEEHNCSVFVSRFCPYCGYENIRLHPSLEQVFDNTIFITHFQYLREVFKKFRVIKIIGFKKELASYPSGTVDITVLLADGSVANIKYDYVDHETDEKYIKYGMNDSASIINDIIDKAKIFHNIEEYYKWIESNNLD